jgi:prepilin-type N-terminal cleavage/methylation domain-containing protein
MQKPQRAFTLVELMIVVAILGISLALVIAGITAYLSSP